MCLFIELVQLVIEFSLLNQFSCYFVTKCFNFKNCDQLVYTVFIFPSKTGVMLYFFLLLASPRHARCLGSMFIEVNKKLFH